MSAVRDITQEVAQHRKAEAIGGGWYRGPSAGTFLCEDCDKTIAIGSDIAVKDEHLTFTFLHGECFDQRPRNRRYARG